MSKVSRASVEILINTVLHRITLKSLTSKVASIGLNSGSSVPVDFVAAQE